jgi:predicted ATPase
MDLARETAGDLRAEVERGGKPYDVAVALLRVLDSGELTVLVLEDLHWADEATLDVFRLLGRRIGTLPLMMIGSYRSRPVVEDGSERCRGGRW